MRTMTPHLYFDRTKTKGVTYKWKVTSCHDNTTLGEIKWHPQWRQYIFEPRAECVWSHECLTELSEYIKEHKTDRNKP